MISELSLRPLFSSRSDSECVISLSSLGHYRLNVMEELRRRCGSRIAIFAGTSARDPSMRILSVDDFQFEELQNWHFKGDLLLQNIPWRRYFAARSLMLDLNPRVLHVWILLVVRRALRRRTILWGHVWPRQGRVSRSEVVRRRMRSLSSGVVAYTNSEARELRETQPRLTVFAAPNALYSRRQMGFEVEAERFRVLYVGRLVDAKKPQLLLDAFSKATTRLTGVRLTFVGEGPELAGLRAQANASMYKAQVEFLGHIEEQDRLRSLYAQAIVSVSPGCVGLSATQSFGFGVPMIISENEPHGPEIEAAEPELNCLFFQTDDSAALRAAILHVCRNRKHWSALGPQIAASCAANYSVERMVDGLVAALAAKPR